MRKIPLSVEQDYQGGFYDENGEFYFENDKKKQKMSKNQQIYGVFDISSDEEVEGQSKQDQNVKGSNNNSAFIKSYLSKNLVEFKKSDTKLINENKVIQVKEAKNPKKSDKKVTFQDDLNEIQKIPKQQDIDNEDWQSSEESCNEDVIMQQKAPSQTRKMNKVKNNSDIKNEKQLKNKYGQKTLNLFKMAGGVIGMGLGKNLQGREAPVEAIRKTQFQSTIQNFIDASTKRDIERQEQFSDRLEQQHNDLQSTADLKESSKERAYIQRWKKDKKGHSLHNHTPLSINYALTKNQQPIQIFSDSEEQPDIRKQKHVNDYTIDAKEDYVPEKYKFKFVDMTGKNVQLFGTSNNQSIAQSNSIEDKNQEQTPIPSKKPYEQIDITSLQQLMLDIKSQHDREQLLSRQIETSIEQSQNRLIGLQYELAQAEGSIKSQQDTILFLNAVKIISQQMENAKDIKELFAIIDQNLLIIAWCIKKNVDIVSLFSSKQIRFMSQAYGVNEFRSNFENVSLIMLDHVIKVKQKIESIYAIEQQFQVAQIDLFENLSAFSPNLQIALNSKHNKKIVKYIKIILVNSLYPLFREYINNIWQADNALQSEILIKFIERCQDSALLCYLQTMLVDELIIPRLMRQIQEYEYQEGSSNIKNKIHLWIHPWLLYFKDAQKLKNLYKTITNKLQKIQVSWTPQSSASLLECIEPWQKIIPKDMWDSLILRTLLPRFLFFLQNSFEIDPSNQKITDLANILKWEHIVDSEQFVKIIEQTVIDKLLLTIQLWCGRTMGVNKNQDYLSNCKKEMTIWLNGWTQFLGHQILQDLKVKQKIIMIQNHIQTLNQLS